MVQHRMAHTAAPLGIHRRLWFVYGLVLGYFLGLLLNA